MKRNQQKSKAQSKKVNTSNQRQDYSNDLGAYGLEPPKIYRNENRSSQSQQPQRKRQSAPKKNNKKQSARPNQGAQSRRTTQQPQQTVQEKRALQNKKRKLKKKLRKVIGIIAIILSVVAVITVLSLTVFFKIDNIKVTGNSLYTTKQITAVLPIDKDKNLFLADTKGAKQKLEKNLPYIYNVTIERKFPSTIIVNVKEVNIVYAVKNKDKSFTLVDTNLKVLDASSAKQPKNSILIKKLVIQNPVAGEIAEIQNKNIADNIKEITKTIEKLQMGDEITEIYSSDINNNFLLYKGKILFKIGSTKDIEDKVMSALAATDKLNSTNPEAAGEITISDDKQIYFTEK